MITSNRKTPLKEQPVVEELLDGINEWKALPDIIRLTFKGLSDIVRQQEVQISTLKEQLLLKPDIGQISELVDQKLASIVTDTQTSKGDLKVWQENIDDQISSVSTKQNEQWMEIENYLNLLRSEIQEAKINKDEYSDINYKIFKAGKEVKRKMKIAQRKYEDSMDKKAFSFSNDLLLIRNEIQRLLRQHLNFESFKKSIVKDLHLEQDNYHKDLKQEVDSYKSSIADIVEDNKRELTERKSESHLLAQDTSNPVLQRFHRRMKSYQDRSRSPLTYRNM